MEIADEIDMKCSTKSLLMDEKLLFLPSVIESPRNSMPSRYRIQRSYFKRQPSRGLNPYLKRPPYPGRDFLGSMIDIYI